MPYDAIRGAVALPGMPSPEMTTCSCDLSRRRPFCNVPDATHLDGDATRRHRHCCCHVVRRRGMLSPAPRWGNARESPCPERSPKVSPLRRPPPWDQSPPVTTAYLWAADSDAPCSSVVTKSFLPRGRVCSGHPSRVGVSPEFLPHPTMAWLGGSFPDPRDMTTTMSARPSKRRLGPCEVTPG